MMTRLMIATGWVIAIGLLVFYVPPAALVMAGQLCWRKSPGRHSGTHRVRPAHAKAR